MKNYMSNLDHYREQISINPLDIDGNGEIVGLIEEGENGAYEEVIEDFPRNIPYVHDKYVVFNNTTKILKWMLLNNLPLTEDKKIMVKLENYLSETELMWNDNKIEETTSWCMYTYLSNLTELVKDMDLPVDFLHTVKTLQANFELSDRLLNGDITRDYHPYNLQMSIGVAWEIIEAFETEFLLYWENDAFSKEEVITLNKIMEKVVSDYFGYFSFLINAEHIIANSVEGLLLSITKSILKELHKLGSEQKISQVTFFMLEDLIKRASETMRKNGIRRVIKENRRKCL